MYQRFLSATLRVAVITVLLLAIVLGSIAAYFIRRIYQEQVDTLASRVVVAVAYRQASNIEVTPEYLDSIAGHDQVTVTLSDGTKVANEAESTGPQFVATRTDPLGQVTATASTSQAESYLTIGVVALVIVVVSGIALAVAYRVADRESRRVNRPLGDLAAHAETIGSGVATRKAKPTGIDEIDRIARVLDDRGATVRDVLEAERRTSREMSHQVRTPLTALSLRLEEIIATDDLAEQPWRALGPTRTQEVLDLLAPLARTVFEAGAVPRRNPIGVTPAGPVAAQGLAPPEGV